MIDKLNLIIIFLIGWCLVKHWYYWCTNLNYITLFWKFKLVFIVFRNTRRITVLNIVDEGFCYVVWTQGSFRSSLGRNLYFELFINLTINDFSKVQSSEFDGKPNETIVIPFHNEVIVGFCESAEGFHEWTIFEAWK